MKSAVESVGNAKTSATTTHNEYRQPEVSSSVLARNKEVRALAFGVLGLAFWLNAIPKRACPGAWGEGCAGRFLAEIRDSQKKTD